LDSKSSDQAALTPLPETASTGLKIVIVGGFGVGKTTMVRSVSEIRPLSTEETMTRASTLPRARSPNIRYSEPTV
jgi:signal recognition particle receptor subunit beta